MGQENISQQKKKFFSKSTIFYLMDGTSAVIFFVISYFSPKWFKFSGDVANLGEILSVLLPLTVIMIKVSITELINNDFAKLGEEEMKVITPALVSVPDIRLANAKILEEISAIRKQTGSLPLALKILKEKGELDDLHEKYALEVLTDTEEKMRFISEDRIPLSEDAFFDMLVGEFKKLKKGDSVLAVNAFETARWTVDPRERIYFEENKKARERGAEIERIFILDQFPDNDKDLVSRAVVLQRHIDIGVRVFVVYKKELHRRDDLLKDFLLFVENEPCVYEDFEDKIDKTRISNGELHLSKASYDEFFKYYSQLKEFVVSDDELKALLEQSASREG